MSMSTATPTPTLTAGPADLAAYDVIEVSDAIAGGDEPGPMNTWEC